MDICLGGLLLFLVKKRLLKTEYGFEAEKITGLWFARGEINTQADTMYILYLVDYLSIFPFSCWQNVKILWIKNVHITLIALPSKL